MMFRLERSCVTRPGASQFLEMERERVRRDRQRLRHRSRRQAGAAANDERPNTWSRTGCASAARDWTTSLSSMFLVYSNYETGVERDRIN
jgi:hypothetical protein